MIHNLKGWHYYDNENMKQCTIKNIIMYTKANLH